MFNRVIRWFQWRIWNWQYRRYRAMAWAAGCTAMSFDMWMREREADEDYAAGRFKEYDSMDEFIADLDEGGDE